MRRSAPTPFHHRRRPSRVAPLIAALLAVASLLLSGVAASAATPVDQWTGTSADGGNSGTDAGERVLTAAAASKIRTAWTRTDTIGKYPPVVLSGVVYTVGESTAGGTVVPQLVASSPRTGATLWTLKLPGGSAAYGYGTAGSGHTVLVAYRSEPGGVLAIDTSTRRIAWRASFPASSIAGSGDDYPGLPVTDGTRVYITGSSNVVNAYSLTTGARLWTIPFTFNSNGGINGVGGIAAVGGLVYTSGSTSGGLGLVAYNASTGKKTWSSTTAQAYGTPVVAGGRVLVSTLTGVAAYPAAGCGRTTCAPTWTRAVAAYSAGEQTVGSVDGTSVFVTSRIAATGAPACDVRFVGTVTRLAASTGAVQWRTTVGETAAELVRGGDTVWLVNEYRSTANGCAEQDRILGYSTTATGTTAVASISLPSAYWGFPQTLAVASGTLFESTSAFVGYRIPNS